MTQIASDRDVSQGTATYNSEAWERAAPRGSVLLFPGAVMAGTLEPAPKHEVVVHCDACGNEIEGDVFRCTTCFDYDLCGNCYPAAAASHADGKHSFLVEK